MNEPFTRRMAELDEAENLLACTRVRGIAGDFRTQMDINRLILDGARQRLDGEESPEGAPAERPADGRLIR